MDRFAAIEREAVVADVDRVRLARDEMHLDAPGHRVVEGVVAEPVQVEVAAELAVDARQQVQIERRSHALGVVIGGVQDVRVFLQIDADQHGAARTDLAARHLEEGLRLIPPQIADGRAGEVDDTPRVAAIRRDAQRVREIRGNRHDAQAREFAPQALHRCAQRVGGDVDRHVHRRLQRADQEARLQALAATVFQQRAAPAGDACDVLEMALGDAELGARRVILAQAADLLEETAAGGVVEILGR